MVKIKVPGKLYLAGEYAVVEPGNPAILTAVNRFVYLDIQKSMQSSGTIYSHQYQTHPVNWKRKCNQLIELEEQIQLDYVMEAIRITEKYAVECGKKLCFFDLDINSELDSTDGHKFGLGSSAAVTVGIVKAVAALYELNLTPLTIFKLAAIAHYNVQGNGSLGDIAAIAYTGWIAYYSPDRDWLKVQNHQRISHLVNSVWPKLKIVPLTPPKGIALLTGWTGSPASTKKLVAKVKQQSQRKYNDFVHQSHQCVEKLIMAIKERNFSLIKNTIALNRQLLNQLSQVSGIELETPKLKKMVTVVNQFGGAAKLSGAGGGDCGIGLVNSKQKIDTIYQEWRKNDILPLQIKTYTNEE